MSTSPCVGSLPHPWLLSRDLEVCGGLERRRQPTWHLGADAAGEVSDGTGMGRGWDLTGTKLWQHTFWVFLPRFNSKHFALPAP